VIDDLVSRLVVANALTKELDDLARDRMTGLVEEPDITSRLGQRLEDRFEGRQLGGYRVRVMSETFTSHGFGSLEKPVGADLYLAVSVEDRHGHGRTVTKGVLIQAKRRDRIDRPEFTEQCRRMMNVTRKGSVAWIYTSNGVDVVRATETLRGTWNVLRAGSFFDEVLRCTLGDLRQVPKGAFGDRRALKEMLQKIGAENAVWLDLEKSKGSSKRFVRRRAASPDRAAGAGGLRRP
jgi:hypothetical protein